MSKKEFCSLLDDALRGENNAVLEYTDLYVEGARADLDEPFLEMIVSIQGEESQHYSKLNRIFREFCE